MDPGKTCSVRAREWRWKDTGASWELWLAEGPLQDWSSWDDWGGDNHCLWHRVYPYPEWGLPEVVFRRSLPEERRWRFDGPPLVVDTAEAGRAQEHAWASREAKRRRQNPPESEVAAAAGSEAEVEAAAGSEADTAAWGETGAAAADAGLHPAPSQEQGAGALEEPC
mmetsp:Transcript_54200/g.145095  ORF Transcript_54200/g.145095 Transcript_54200/m.145095 type:complete len:167 (-) Transcript_54200:58-558(-)